MKIIQKKYSSVEGWCDVRQDEVENYEVDLVLAFGPPEIVCRENLYQEIRDMFPMAQVILSSASAGFIDDRLANGELTLTAIRFEKSKVKTAITDIAASKNSFDAGYYLSRAFPHEGLRSLMVFCDGRHVNASQFVFSLQQYLPSQVIITGGVSGAKEIEPSFIGLNNKPSEGRIACIGFYGESLNISYGNQSGWIPFGPERTVTRSKNNTVYELGGIPVLEVYNLYLRDRKYCPSGTPVLFPIQVRFENTLGTVIRTIHSIDESDFSITYSGNVPEGSKVSLLKADGDSLISGAADAAFVTMQQIPAPELALVISCNERRGILNGRTTEEITAFKKTFGSQTAISGVYVPGEIAPAGPDLKCELFKQSVIVTAISEIQS